MRPAVAAQPPSLPSPAPLACSRLLHAAHFATRPHGHVRTRSQQRGACGLTPWTRLQVRAFPQEQAWGCGEWRPLGAPRSRGCGGAAQPQRDSDGKLLHAIAHPVREGGICCCLVPAHAKARASRVSRNKKPMPRVTVLDGDMICSRRYVLRRPSPAPSEMLNEICATNANTPGPGHDSL